VSVNVKINEAALGRVKHALRGAAERVHRHRGTVGIHENEGGDPKHSYDGKDDGDATLAEVAMAHEFGAGNLPDRSWLRTWVDSNEPRLRAEMKEAMRAEFEGDKSAVDKQAAAWGRELRAWVENQEGHLRGLEESTITEKRAANLPHPETPLLATGQLVAAITAHLDGNPVT
jgi:hypothetical protein